MHLNDNGSKQAKKAAGYLHDNEQIEAIYCSDLSRTRETAEAVADVTGLKINYDFRLREASFGLWEGMTFSEVYKKNRNEFDEWYRDVWNYKIPEGENFLAVVERVWQAIEEIASRHDGTVLIVTHGGVVRALMSTIDPSLDIWKIPVESASMTYFEWKYGNYCLLNANYVVE
ncbi:MAG: histidine phosphatase family protein [Bacillota bacterium]|nr:histidine phosphatase family protein [Bacillota bacterium]